MRNRIFFLFVAALLCISCNKQWQSSNELGVNTTRINISSTQEGDFRFPIYSNTDWKLVITEGTDWLSGNCSGSGIKDVVLTYSENAADDARIAKFTVTTGSGKSVSVNVVQSGLIQSASSIKDSIL